MYSIVKPGSAIAMAVIGLMLALPVQAEADANQDWHTDYQLGGCGGAYFLAAPGELWVEVEKRDLNLNERRTFLRAILFGPDRQVIKEAWLDDDGAKAGSGPGPVQRVRLSTTVEAAGIYGLNITVTNDRYGAGMIWGMKTNCPHYLIETSRGHRDAAHEEPLALRSPGREGDVCFAPQAGAFMIEAAGLAAGAAPLTVYDAEGREAGTLPVSEEGKASGQFDAGAYASRQPWRLHLPDFKADIHIDGVTRWKAKDAPFANLSLWTPDKESWFAFHENRWLLTPYRRLVYGQAGEEGVIEFEVHNNGLVEQKVEVSLEFPDGTAWPAELETPGAPLKPRASAPVTLRYRVPGEGASWTCRLRATSSLHPEVSTYSTVELRKGVAPAAEPIPMPIVLKPYEHQNAQFGYLPKYPLTNEVYFDMANEPVIAASGAVHVLRGGEWTALDKARGPDGAEGPFALRTSKIAFDQDNGLYTLGTQGQTSVLLYAAPDREAFSAYPIPGSGGGDIEQFSGHNVPAGPPPFVRITRTAKDPKLMWRSLNDLALFLPEKAEDGALTLGEPILISKKCIGFSAHSGIPSSIVSRGSKVHVAFGEATEPEANAPGVPTFVATYDRETGALSEPALVGYGPPANDVHNTPCITMDSQGYLHVLIGTHGRTFKYARSLKPNDASAGWTEAEDLGPGLRQTYIGLVCDANDTLHVVFRLWHTDGRYFPDGYYPTLSYMSKRPGEAWSEPWPLVVAALSEYSVFYHRLTIDRESRLFLSHDYWSTFWFYRTDHWGTRRALLMSPDQGETWKLADMTDMRQ